MAHDHNLPTSVAELLGRYANGERDFAGRVTGSDGYPVGVRLERADLRGADLAGASLVLARLSGADLRGADLTGATLRNASLAEADLRGANLSAADLSSTDVNAARFEGAIFRSTTLVGVNLTSAYGLSQVDHWAPSVLDHRTLASCGQLPVDFLRGVGFSDWEIEFSRLHEPNLSRHEVDEIAYAIANARGGKALNFQSVFISHATVDEAFTRRLYDDLQDAGVRCYFFPEDRKGGHKVHEQLSEAIHLHDRLLLCLSEASMASDWVRFEIEEARRREKKENRRILFPIRLVPFERIQSWSLFDADLARDAAKEIREYYIPDFSDPTRYSEEFDRLVKNLADEPGRMW